MFEFKMISEAEPQRAGSMAPEGPGVRFRDLPKDGPAPSWGEMVPESIWVPYTNLAYVVEGKVR